MSRPACANPANIRHIVKPEPGNLTGRFCYQECVCGELVSMHQCSASAHPPHPRGCDCEITPADCIDCDAEFTPTDAEQDQCPACIAKEASR